MLMQSTVSAPARANLADDSVYVWLNVEYKHVFFSYAIGVASLLIWRTQARSLA